MKTISETRPGNVTPFVLEGRWALDGLDQSTMRWLSKIAKRKHVAVADVIYEAIESFLARWEAEAELETKIIKFPTSLKDSRRRIANSSSTNSVSNFSARTIPLPVAAMRVSNPDGSPVGINC